MGEARPRFPHASLDAKKCKHSGTLHLRRSTMLCVTIARRTSPTARNSTHSSITLSLDIGGTGIKGMLLDAKGQPRSERMRVLTPAKPTPAAVLKCIDQIAAALPGFDRVSVGFPGVIRQGITYLSVNLHPRWKNCPLAATLEEQLGKPVRAANDADVAGGAAVTGHGVELVITLGTGLGSALFTNGHLCPGLELGHHPWKSRTYEGYLGRAGLKRSGKLRWNKALLAAISETAKLFNWDHLYLGGGNTKKITAKLPKNVSIVSNELGLTGGAALWHK